MLSEERKNVIGFFYNENEDPNENSLCLTYSIGPDENIWKIHSLCKRFCLAMGYSEASVERVFGETTMFDE